jgi:23S rRNA (uracil1939-C5)-methyltransferase
MRRMAVGSQTAEDASPVVELELTDLAYGGDAVGRHAGRAMFVAGGLPGEVVRARVIRDRGSYARAELVEVLQASADRVEPRYPDLTDSGGFQWQHLSYPAQLMWKTRIVRQLLMRIGRFAHPTVHPMIGMPPESDTWRYRTVAQFAVSEEGAIGFRRAGSHEVIDMPTCPIAHPALDRLYERVHAWLRDRWGTEAGRYVERFTLRVAASDASVPYPHLLPPGVPALPRQALAPARESGHATTDGAWEPPALLGLEVRPGGALDAAGGPQAVGEALLRAVPSLTGVVIIGLPGGRGRFPIGQDYLYDRVYDRVFRISAGSFFQVNATQTPVLVERALVAARPRSSDLVLDGYSGVGLFSLFLASRAQHVNAIESQPSAVADASASLGINGIVNVSTVEGVLERTLGTLARQGERVDVALVDPPRAGCHPRALATLRQMAPRTFVYVSCDPSTLARDLQLFCGSAYRLVHVQPVDLFPHTAHIECVALCERAGG